MAETKIVYKKVITNTSKERLSAFMGNQVNLPYRLALRYDIGKVTVPTIGKIFAFKTLDDARHWPFGDEVWEARATDVEPCRRHIFTDGSTIKYCLTEFWKREIAGKKRAPKGTVLCSSLELIKKVSPEWRR